MNTNNYNDTESGYISITLPSYRNSAFEEIGYEPKTTFWSDFSIADPFGASAVQDTYDRAFREWRDNYIYLTELVLVLNHKIWQWHKRSERLAAIYDRLWRDADDYAIEHLTGNELAYYFDTTD